MASLIKAVSFYIMAIVCLVACDNERVPAQKKSEPVVTNSPGDTVVKQAAESTTTKLTEPNDEHLLVKLFSDNSETKFDTVVHYSFLENDMFPLATFNYPTLANKSENENSLTIFNDSLSVRITRQPFNPKEHKLVYSQPNNVEEKFLKTIDGKNIFGTDGNVPQFEIAEVSIVLNDKTYLLPKEEIRNYFEPNFHLTDVYLTADGRIIIWMINSDGAGGYYLVWIWKNRKVQKRLVELGF